MKISSLTNPKVKNVVKLRDRKAREETGLTIVEGMREVLCAQDSDADIQEVYICPDLFLLEETDGTISNLIERMAFVHVPVYEVSRAVHEKMSFGDRKEGIVAVFRPSIKSLYELPLPENPLVVVVENIEKPGNLGAILRTCDGAGVDALIVSDEDTDIYNPNCIRSSLGTVFHVPVSQGKKEEIHRFFKENKIFMVATSPAAPARYTEVDYTAACAVMMGREQDGLSDFWLREADTRVSIPMRGQANSLNVSVSTGLIVYEAVRQRGKVV